MVALLALDQAILVRIQVSQVSNQYNFGKDVDSVTALLSKHSIASSPTRSVGQLENLNIKEELDGQKRVF